MSRMSDSSSRHLSLIPRHPFLVILNEVEGPLATATFVLAAANLPRHFDQRGEISCRETTFVKDVGRERRLLTPARDFSASLEMTTKRQLAASKTVLRLRSG